MRENKLRLALFDLDGTITTKNIFIEFVKYAFGTKRYKVGLCHLTPYVLAFYCRFISDTKLKSVFINYFFKGISIIDYSNIIKQFNTNMLPMFIRPDALEKIVWHQKRNDRVIVISACIDSWVKEWCDLIKIELIGTKVEEKSGYLTGKLLTKNCSGFEKVRRLKEYIDISLFNYIYAYGDSNGDREMFKIAHECFYKTFNNN
jgi:phosphatidylglycerophosphatase C